ncbi:hypothetical protein [Sessilibacter sp. MAH2]
MADIHIADFYKDCASIFVTLYRNFPRKIQLYVDDIAGADEPDEFGLPSPRHSSCFATMVWLAESGYIQYQTNIRQEALDLAQLTHLGFMLLSSPRTIPISAALSSPTDLDLDGPQSSANHIHNLRQQLRTGSSNAIERAVTEVFAQSYRYRG